MNKVRKTVVWVVKEDKKSVLLVSASEYCFETTSSDGRNDLLDQL